ncbi:hypothetical protein [Sphingomonas crusticola]|uniref:hypothetical protein n=1 Tax=Sphingomonas crusticola TaxID=1697973 RepID=UPI000E26D2CA|nr:hypothetical protein [Sphingomonas crusticola]
MLSLLLFAAAIATTKPKMGPIEIERKMVVDAVRGCPEAASEDEIVVCSNDRGIAEGYRLPKLDPRFDVTLRPKGRGALTDRDLGRGGVGSCSTTGAGGSTGCSLRGINNWAEEQRRKKAADRAYQDPN